MGFKKLKCPECGRILKAEQEHILFYCQYCGCKIIFDDESKEETINENIYKNINYTKRYVNEADVIRAKNEIEKDKIAFKQFITLIIIPIVILCIAFLGLNLNDIISKSQGKINAGYYDDLIGQDYKTVAAHFEAAGFTNIELIDLNDSGIVFWNNDKVENISVGGKVDFGSGDWFEPNTKVVISYH